MSARNTWHIPPKVEVDGKPVSLLRTGAFVLALILLMGAIVIWKRVY